MPHSSYKRSEYIDLLTNQMPFAFFLATAVAVDNGHRFERHVQRNAVQPAAVVSMVCQQEGGSRGSGSCAERNLSSHVRRVEQHRHAHALCQLYGVFCRFLFVCLMLFDSTLKDC